MTLRKHLAHSWTALILLFLLIPNSIRAQEPSDWYWLNPLPQGNRLFGVAFVDTDTGTAVGEFGTILRTTDGGTTWTVQESGTTADLRGVFFLDADTGTAVGTNGTILRTTDGGATWTPQESGTAYTLYDVQFTDAATGAVVGASCTVLLTTDGGVTWVLPMEGIDEGSCYGAPIWGIDFADPLTAMTVGGTDLRYGSQWACLHKTMDGGDHWDRILGTWMDRELLDISFVNGDTAVAVGGRWLEGPIWQNCCEIFRTTDGGQSWLDVLTTMTFGKLRGVAFGDAGRGIAVGSVGLIYHTTDGGATWSQASSSTSNSMHGVSFIGANTATAVGAGGMIVRTTDGGEVWGKQVSGVSLNRHFNSISFGDANTATVVGNAGTIIRTEDGGETWIEQESGTSNCNFYDVSFTSADTGTAVGWWIYSDMGFSYAEIYRTIDGGETWVRQLRNGDGATFVSVHFTDANTGTAVGCGIYRTTDGGETWVPQEGNITDCLRSVYFTDSDTGTAVGNDGTIIRTTNGGDTWIIQVSNTTSRLRRVHFIDTNTGTVVGDDGTILRTTDGGETWTPQASPTSVTLLSVFFTDENTGTITGSGGRIIRTTNGGATWTLQESVTPNDLNGVFFTDTDTGIVVGSYCTILGTTAGGGVAVMLTEFAAAWRNDHAEVTWSVNAEALESHLTFYVSRSSDGGISFVPLINPDIRVNGVNFTLKDYTVEPGSSYCYRVVIFKDGKAATEFEVEIVTPALRFSLEQNYPNPFNPMTKIDYYIPKPCYVSLEIFDIAGRLISVLLDKEQVKGNHSINWDGLDQNGHPVSSGIYFYTLTVNKETISKKVVLLR